MATNKRKPIRRSPEESRKLINEIKAQGLDTCPKFLLYNFQKYGANQVAMREKDYGIWNEHTWADCYEQIKYFALGLAALGLERDDKVCCIGDNAPEWYFAELATQALGGTIVGLYVDAIPSEIEYLADHADCRFAVVRDQEQTDKFLSIRDKLPKMQKVIYWDPKGMWAYQEEEFVIDFTEVQRLGREFDREHPTYFEDQLQLGQPEDIAVLCFTSGTSGSLPKAAMISHHYLVQAAFDGSLVTAFYPGDNHVSFVPLAWIAEQFMGLMIWLMWGVVVNFPENGDTVMENIREIGPQIIMLGTRQWEDLYRMSIARINDSTWPKRAVYRLALPIGYRISRYKILERAKVPLLWRLLYFLAYWGCFRHLRDKLGLEKTRTAATGGSLMGPDTLHWFRAIGVRLIDSYGLTEIAPTTMHVDEPKLGTVGPPLPGTKVKVTEDGELLWKNNRMFSGYYKKPELTSEVFSDGWFKSGDAGTIDDEGHVIVFDRLKDMRELRGGYKYSPSYLENKLKFSPFIKDVMVVGDKGHEYPFALINIDFTNVGQWAEKNRLPYTTFTDLSQKDEVYDLIQKDVERTNADLPPTGRLLKFMLLYKEFDPDEGELTRTRKLRRGFLEDRYAEAIEAAYHDRPSLTVETEITYQDGKKGKISLNVNIRTV